MIVDLEPSTPAHPVPTLVFDCNEDAIDGSFVQDLRLAYQPIYSVKTRQMTGCECLLRLTHSSRGAISPSDFIPLLEMSGLIHQVGHSVLHDACAQRQAWARDGHFLHLAVNASSLQLQSKTFVADVDHALKAASMAPSDLTIEITESLPMEWSGVFASNVAALMAHGVKIVLDDFGSGFGSLIHLKHPGIHAIKIDCAIVRDVHVNPTTRVMLKHVCHLAHDLGIRVIAEGVEVQDQFDALSLIGADDVQGFLFSPAVEPQALSAIYGSMSRAA